MFNLIYNLLILFIQKGSHFSLLGGNIKKELEKSTQALDAANLDLEKKIKENGNKYINNV